jgi:hypothetical protein
MRIAGRGGESTPFTGGTVQSHGDHRIAMAFAVAGLRAAGSITILDTENVATSFPGFAAMAGSVGMLLRAGTVAVAGEVTPEEAPSTEGLATRAGQ